MKTSIFKQCQNLFPDWASASMEDFDFDDPKGFSSFTMGIRSRIELRPQAVLYRRLAEKKNAILDFETEKEVFLTLAAHKIAAHCYHYDENCRLEAFYSGSTLVAGDLFEPEILRKIANELYRLHQIQIPSVPQEMFFDLLHNKWGRLAQQVLEEKITAFPPGERKMCDELREIYSPETLRKVKKCMPKGPLTFCHNDTYHGNIMQLDNGDIKLLDFEFSCLNHKAYDFSNLFAETVMEHQLPDYPYFRIAAPKFGDNELSLIINFYLDNQDFKTLEAREKEFQQLLQDVKSTLLLSDYKYAMAALPLAVEPIQKIRFIPYAHQRYFKFLQGFEERFG